MRLTPEENAVLNSPICVGCQAQLTSQTRANAALLDYPICSKCSLAMFLQTSGACVEAEELRNRKKGKDSRLKSPAEYARDLASL